MTKMGLTWQQTNLNDYEKLINCIGIATLCEAFSHVIVFADNITYL